jgi:hypothetical protein
LCCFFTVFFYAWLISVARLIKGSSFRLNKAALSLALSLQPGVYEVLLETLNKCYATLLYTTPRSPLALISVVPVYP